jgi:predicted enzyme related to lactoylglutathione lyase
LAKAVGIGGVFLDFKGEQQAVMDWYETYLGFDMTPYGTGFIEGTQYVLLSFKREDNPNAPYLNIRVDDIEEIFQVIKQQDLQILSEITEYPYGKFAQFIDPFGNPIELWQVYEEAYKEMVKKEVEAYKNKKDN